MSTLFVNNLNTASGSTITVPTGKQLIVTDAGAVRVPGSVMQVVEGTGGAGELSVTSTSYAATGCKLSITPVATSSKVLIFASSGYNYVGGTNDSIVFAIYKNSSSLKQDITRVRNNAGGTGVATPLSFHFLDSPNTTSSTEYEIYIKVNTAGDTGQFNSGTTVQARLCLMEIAG
mgnify:CR=1 FL=1|tara:strand:- start:87 stop:611 length:525 start_codon:yes stop_codon:yes gene_type:complete